HRPGREAERLAQRPEGGLVFDAGSHHVVLGGDARARGPIDLELGAQEIGEAAFAELVLLEKDPAGADRVLLLIAMGADAGLAACDLLARREDSPADVERRGVAHGARRTTPLDRTAHGMSRPGAIQVPGHG